MQINIFVRKRVSKIFDQYQLKSWNHKWIFLESVRLLNRSLEAIIEFSILYIVLYLIRPVLLLVTRLHVYFIPSTINVTNEVSLSDGCSSKSSPFLRLFLIIKKSIFKRITNYTVYSFKSGLAFTLVRGWWTGQSGFGPLIIGCMSISHEYLEWSNFSALNVTQMFFYTTI